MLFEGYGSGSGLVDVVAEITRSAPTSETLARQVFKADIEGRLAKGHVSIQEILEIHDDIIARVQKDGGKATNLLNLRFLTQHALHANENDFTPGLLAVMERLDNLGRDSKTDIKQVYLALKTIAGHHVCGDTQSVYVARHAVGLLHGVIEKLAITHPEMREEALRHNAAVNARIAATFKLVESGAFLSDGGIDEAFAKAQKLCATSGLVIEAPRYATVPSGKQLNELYEGTWADLEEKCQAIRARLEAQTPPLRLAAE